MRPTWSLSFKPARATQCDTESTEGVGKGEVKTFTSSLEIFYRMESNLGKLRPRGDPESFWV